MSIARLLLRVRSYRLCCVPHPDDIRSSARSVSNLEFHRAGADVDKVAQRIAAALSALGHPSINPSMAFPMEMDDSPGRSWIVSQKTVAVAAQGAWACTAA